MESDRRMRPEELNAYLQRMHPSPSQPSRLSDPATDIRLTNESSDAELWREKGNISYKSGDFTEAIRLYTKSIEALPTCAAYANRSMAHLRLGDAIAAERDASSALALDSTHVKALLRRASARHKLGRLEAAIEDIESVLRLEPGNKEALQERLARLEEWSLQQAIAFDLKGMQPHVIQVRLAAPNPADTEAIMKEVSTHRTIIDSGEGPEGGRAAAGTGINGGGGPSNRPPVRHPMEIERTQERSATVAIPSEPLGKDNTLSERSVTNNNQVLLPKAPKTGVEFERAWRSLSASDKATQATYLLGLDPAQVAMLLKQILSPGLLAELQLAILGPGVAQDPVKALQILEELTRVPRFDLLAMGLSTAQKREVAKGWDDVARKLDGNALFGRLRQKYKV